MERTEIRQLDEVGRIVLPREFRRALAWGEETNVAVQLDGDRMVLFAQPSQCFLCAGQEDLRKAKDRYICKACIAKLNEE